MPPKGGDKSAQFWSAIISQKQDTIRWSFNYGGINPFTRDDDGYCGIHVAAKSNKVRARARARRPGPPAAPPPRRPSRPQRGWAADHCREPRTLASARRSAEQCASPRVCRPPPVFLRRLVTRPRRRQVRSLESILDHIRRGIMSKGGGDTRGVKGKGASLHRVMSPHALLRRRLWATREARSPRWVTQRRVELCTRACPGVRACARTGGCSRHQSARAARVERQQRLSEDAARSCIARPSCILDLHNVLFIISTSIPTSIISIQCYLNCLSYLPLSLYLSYVSSKSKSTQCRTREEKEV